MEEFDVYTGKLEYKNIKFDFVYKNGKLNLNPEDSKKYKTYQLFINSFIEEKYESIYIDSILKGISNETCKEIIFFPKRKPVGNCNFALIVEIESYIVKKYDKDLIDRIGIKGAEIDYIFPTTQALDSLKWKETGNWQVTTRDFSSTTSKKQKFKVDEKEVTIYFSIARTLSRGIGVAPIYLQSVMYFEFLPTDDYQFIKDVVLIGRQFIRYLCYRRNIVFSDIMIDSPTDNCKHQTFGNMYELYENTDIEKYALKKNKYIEIKLLDGKEGKILNDIASNKLYLKHLPKSYEEGRHIDAARFIMITSAFEWEFKRNYKNGIDKNKKTIEAEDKVESEINKLIETSSGKSKKIYKFLKKLIRSDSLSTEIKQVSKDYNDLIDIFGQHLYRLNNEKLDYNNMGGRLATQRNNFAHGNLDKEFIGNSLLDLIFLEYIIYIMQLKRYNIDDISIKKAINELFGCNLFI